MSVERSPVAGSKTARVLEAINQGTPRVSLPQVLGMGRREVSYAIQDLRRLGFLNRPTSEETRRTMKESVSQARGNIWLNTEPYVRMGMFSREVRFALQNEKHIDIPADRINAAITKARTRGDIQKRTEEEKVDIRIDSHKEEKESRETSRKWLFVRDLLVTEGIDLPQSRLQWKELIKRVESFPQHNRPDQSRKIWGVILNIISDDQTNSLEDDKPLAFAKEIIKAGLVDIKGDPLDRKKINEIFKDRNESFTYRVILEAFVYVKKHAITSGDWSLVDKYWRIGNQVNSEWFGSEKLKTDRLAVIGFLPKAGDVIVDDSSPYGSMTGEEIGRFSREHDGRDE